MAGSSTWRDVRPGSGLAALLVAVSWLGASACAPGSESLGSTRAALLADGYQEIPLPTICPPADPDCTADAAYARDYDAVCRTDWLDGFECVVPHPLKPGETVTLAYEITLPASSGLPAGTSCEAAAAPGTFPLVVVVPGTGQSPDDYDQVHEVLALNGIMVASVNPTIDPASYSASPSLRADLTLAFLGCLLEDVPENLVLPRWNRALGLFGHSNGGEAVTQIARDGDISSIGGVQLSAVLALAPSDIEMSVPPDSDLLPECAQGTIASAPTPEDIAALMVIQGSDDYDTNTSGLGYFDAVGSEHPGASATPFTRSTVFVTGARHNGFLDRDPLLGPLADGELDCFPIGEGVLADATQRHILRAYTHAFFRMYLLGDRRFRGLITGQTTAPSIHVIAAVNGDEDVAILHQFSEGLAAHRVIDHLECPDGCVDCWSEPSLVGGEVIAQNVWVHENREELWEEYRDARSRALHVAWQTTRREILSEGEPRVHFGIPNVPDPHNGYGDVARTPGGSYQDLRAFTHVSMRIGQIPLPPWPEQTKDMRVELTDADGHMVSVVTSVGAQANEDATGEPSPTAGLIQTVRDPAPAYDGFGAFIEDHPPVTLTQTIRLPLSAFCDGTLDLNRIARISVGPDTNVPETEFYGWVWLDNVELVAERFGRPVGLSCPGTCGNGVVDADEECDDANFDDEDACTAQCTVPVVDTCDGGALGDPGCPCLETPTSEGVAAYFQDGRYCNEPSSICRPSTVNPGTWTCEPCYGPDANMAGCPCADDGECGGNGFTCYDAVQVGADPVEYPVPGPHPGVCWEPGDVPEGYCLGWNCEAQARVCGQVLSPDLAHECYTAECAEPLPTDACEETDGLVCHRDTATCQPVCSMLDPTSCPTGYFCTAWGECWPG